MPKVPLEVDIPNLDDESRLSWLYNFYNFVGGFRLPIGLWMVWRILLVFDLVQLYDCLNKL